MQTPTQEVNYSSNSKSYSYILFNHIDGLNKIILSDRKDKKATLALGVAWFSQLLYPYATQQDIDAARKKMIEKNPLSEDKEISEYQKILLSMSACMEIMQDNNLIPPKLYIPVLVHKDPDEESGKTTAYEYIETLRDKG